MNGKAGSRHRRSEQGLFSYPSNAMGDGDSLPTNTHIWPTNAEGIQYTDNSSSRRHAKVLLQPQPWSRSLRTRLG